MRNKILNFKSNTVTNGEPKLPTPSELEYGELAINYAAGKETISIKNDNNQIVTFKPQTSTMSYAASQEVVNPQPTIMNLVIKATSTDETQPLANISVTITYKDSTNSYMTDSNGIVSVDIPNP